MIELHGVTSSCMGINAYLLWRAAHHHTRRDLPALNPLYPVIRHLASLNWNRAILQEILDHNGRCGRA